MNSLTSIIKSNKKKSKHEIAQFLSSIQILRLTEEQSAKCEISVSEDEVICTLKNMPKNKSPGNNGLTKYFFETFWDGLKIPFTANLKKSSFKEE